MELKNVSSLGFYAPRICRPLGGVRDHWIHCGKNIVRGSNPTPEEKRCWKYYIPDVGSTQRRKWAVDLRDWRFYTLGEIGHYYTKGIIPQSPELQSKSWPFVVRYTCQQIIKYLSLHGIEGKSFFGAESPEVPKPRVDPIHWLWEECGASIPGRIWSSPVRRSRELEGCVGKYSKAQNFKAPE